MLRARALEQALRMLIDAAVQTACKIAEDGDRRWHVVDLVCATNDAEKLLAVDPAPSGASPQAEELRAANVANLREMVGMAGRYRETLLAVRECILALSPGHRTGYDWNADPLFLTLKEGRALNLIDDAMKATPASPQAETSDDLSELWRQELYPHVEPDTFKRFLCDLTAEGWDDVRKEVFALQSIVDSRPAPVSPVEPEPPQVYHHYFAGATLTTCGVPIERGHVMPELNDVTCETCRQAWHERPVEPEPPEELPCYCDIPSHILDLGCPRHQAPQCEPEPPWREKYNELLFAVARAYPGESRHDTALRYIREKETAEACGPKAPLKVER